MCEVTRERLMQYFDGELDQGESAQVAVHVAACPRCQGEMKNFQSLDHLIHRFQEEEALSTAEEQAYYPCVCRKLTEGGSWVVIYWVALGVLGVGTLLLFSLPRTPLFLTMGLLALVIAGGIVWLGRYCRCKG
jgi:anti-sigma factor RsiW